MIVESSFRYEWDDLDFGLLDEIRSTGGTQIKPRSKSTTMLQYKHHDEDSAVVRYIKSRINPLNKDLSFIINELGIDHGSAYNLHYSLVKKHRIRMKYTMMWFYLLGIRVRLVCEDVGLEENRRLGIQTDFDIS